MDDKSNSNRNKDNNSNQQHKNTDDIYQSDGFEEIERQSGEESEFSEDDKKEEEKKKNKQQQKKVDLHLTATVINTNANTNSNANTVANANLRNVSNTFEEIIQSRDTDKLNKGKLQPQTQEQPQSKRINTNNAIRLSKEDPQLQLETISLQSEIHKLKEENSFMKIERDKIAHIKDNEILLLQEKLSKLNQNTFMCKKEIEKSAKQISDNKSKISDYDNTILQLNSITNQNDKLKVNNDSLMKVIEALKQERLALASKVETYKTENMTIKQEKMYLLKKTMTQSELIKSLTSKNESNDKEISKLKEDKTKLINKLTSKDIEIERAFRSSIERENNKNKEKTKQEVNELKETFNQLLVNKTKYISDHCDELKQRIYSHEKSLKDKTGQIDFLTIELNNKKRINEEENDHLKLELKIKNEDINRLTVLYNESIQLVQMNQKEICQLKEKYEVLKNELIKNESQSKEEISSYKSKWIFEREKNEDYAQIESELDKVICDSALISTSDEHSLDLMNRLNALPMNNKKRISQCVILANKVKYLLIDNQNLKSSNTLLNIENDKAKDERNMFESIANKMKEPYEYLITKLQVKETENNQLQTLINEKDKVISAVIQDNRRLEEKAKQIEDDLRIVLMNRKQLQNLESIVENHIQEDRNKWELIEWQKQQYEQMNKKQNKIQTHTHLKTTNWSKN